MFIFSLIHLNEAIVNKPNRSGGFSAVTWGILRAVDIKADSGRMLGLLGGEPAPAQPPFGGEESETQGSPGSRRLDGEIWLLSSLFFVSHCDLPTLWPPRPHAAPTLVYLGYFMQVLVLEDVFSVSAKSISWGYSAWLCREENVISEGHSNDCALKDLWSRTGWSCDPTEGTLGIVFHFEVCKVKHKFENLNILKYSFSHLAVNGPWINAVKETEEVWKEAEA